MERADGLAVFQYFLGAHAKGYGPDASNSDGQYWVLLDGSFVHGAQEYENLALIFVKPEEGGFQIKAGSKGLQALVLNFPRVACRE